MTSRPKLLVRSCPVVVAHSLPAVSIQNVRGAGRLAVVTLEDQLLVMTRLRIRLRWLQQELAYIFGVSEAGVSLTFQEVD